MKSTIVFSLIVLISSWNFILEAQTNDSCLNLYHLAPSNIATICQVNAVSGLNIRAKPSISAKKITAIPFKKR